MGLYKLQFLNFVLINYNISLKKTLKFSLKVYRKFWKTHKNIY